MDPERWSRVNDLVGRALDRPPEEWSAFLDGACGDPDVRREAASLLAQDPGAFDEVDAPPLPLLGPAPAIEPGRRIGAYRVIRELGQGGMGVVYLAERADQEYERRVAVKVLKRGLDTAEIVRRFRRERQILARLEHPGIAGLYEGGTTDDGRPYFVLEHVEGEPIVRYCEARELGLRRRLELFRRVCDAVQVAHQNLVVHRDLKPANILVTAGGQPKLLDFGIAKLLHPEGGDGEPQTVLDLRPMTPEYASPEQVKGEPVTTATDVYALGVLLYEMLTGRRPYRSERGGTSASRAELRRAICEDEPMRPSAVVDRKAVGAERDGGTAPVRGLRRRLAGDLDTIVLHAMAKDPRRRYASVERLSEDVERYLRGLPVQARRPTLVYRAGKLFRRRARELAAAVLAVVTLAAFLVDRELQQRRTARALARAERVTGFLVELFEVSDPRRARGSTVTAREVLDRGAARVRDELGQEPEVQAALMLTIGRVYERLGLYEPAEPLLRDALALRRRELGERDADVAEALDAVGMLLRAQGDLREAETVLRRAVAIGRAELGDDHPKVAEYTHDLARVLQNRGAAAEAAALYRRVLELRRRLLGDDHPATVESLNDLAAERYLRGDNEEAERLFREVLAARRRLLGPLHPDVARSVNNLAVVLDRQGEYREAELHYREALDLLRRSLGDDHPDVATSLGILGQFVALHGRLEDAEPLLREALARHRRAVGDRHPEVASDLRELGALLHRKGEYVEAETLMREALEISREIQGERSLSTAVLLNNLGALLVDRGRADEAEAALTRALATFRDLLEPGSPSGTSPLHHLAALHHARGDSAAAEAYYREALAIRRQAYPQGHPRVAVTLTHLADLLVDLDRAAAAEPLAREALEIHRSGSEPGYWRVAQAESVLGAALARLGGETEAEALLVRSHAVLRETLGDRSPEVREAERRLDTLHRAGAPQGAGGS